MQQTLAGNIGSLTCKVIRHKVQLHNSFNVCSTDVGGRSYTRCDLFLHIDALGRVLPNVSDSFKSSRPSFQKVLALHSSHLLFPSVF